MSKTIFNISYGILTKVLTVLISLVLVPIIFENIGASNYGWIGIYSMLLGALYIFDLGLSNIVTKELTQVKNTIADKRIIFHSLEFVYYLIGLSILALLYLFAPIIAKHWFASGPSQYDNFVYLLRLIALTLFAQWPHSFYSSALFGCHQQVRANTIQLSISIFKNLTLIILFHLHLISIIEFFYFQIFISLITSFVLRLYISTELDFIFDFNHISLSYLHNLKRFIFGLSLIGVFGFVYYDLNNILLSKWLSLSEFGHYSIVLNVATSIILITSTIKNSLFPRITESIHEKLSIIQEHYRSHFNLMAYSCIPISVFLFIHSQTLLSFWFDTAMAEKLNISLKYFASGSLFYALMVIPGSYLIANQRSKYLIYSAGFLAALAVPLLYFLVKTFRLEGGSIFWFLINLIPCFFVIIYTQKTILKNATLNLFDGIVFPILISSFFYGGYYLIYQFVHFSFLAHFIFFGLSSGMIAFIFYKKLKFIPYYAIDFDEGSRTKWDNEFH